MSNVELRVGGDMERYGFRDRLTSDFPSQVIVDVTEVCNLACIHCPHPAFKRSHNYAGRLVEQDLNTKLVDEVREFGAGKTQYIRYSSSGEPLVHPKIYDMLEYAVEHSGVSVTLTTNGTMLDEKRIAKLFSSGLHMIDVSIDAVTPETYAAVRVNGDLNVTRANIVKLLKMKQNLGAEVAIVVSFVEQPKNTHEAAAFESFWTDQGADQVVVRRLHSAANAVTDIANRMHSDEEPGSRYPCLYPWERILLNSTGDLIFCPQDWVHGSTIAHYSETTIREVWHGEFYRKLRQAHLSNDFSCHGFCGQCPDWKQTRWPGEGQSYADLVEDCLSEPEA